MKRISRIFLTGLLALVPLALTIMLLVWLGRFAEDALGGFLKFILPAGWYVPGAGIVLGIGLAFCVGLLLQSKVFEWLFGKGESLVERIPLIRSVYGPIREVVNLFSSDDQDIGKPVCVRLPWNDNTMLGFVTQDRLSNELGGEGKCAVYLPMSYQIGGFMVVLDKHQVEPLDMNAQQALRFVFTSGMGGSRGRHVAAGRPEAGVPPPS